MAVPFDNVVDIALQQNSEARQFAKPITYRELTSGRHNLLRSYTGGRKKLLNMEFSSMHIRSKEVLVGIFVILAFLSACSGKNALYKSKITHYPTFLSNY